MLYIGNAARVGEKSGEAMIEHQYSPSVAVAQHALKVESIYQKIREALLKSNLPQALQNTGLQYRSQEDLLYAELHGFCIRVRYDHVWLKDGLPTARLGGRLRFLSITHDGKDGDTLVRVVFDHLGNTRIGSQAGYFSSAADPDDLASLVRSMSLALANAIHAKMDVIDD